MDCCRSCLSTKPKQMYSLSDTYRNLTGHETTYEKMLQDCCGISYSTDSKQLPTKLCNACVNSLRFVYEFRCQTYAAHTTLMQRICEADLEMKVEPVEHPIEHSALALKDNNAGPSKSPSNDNDTSDNDVVKIKIEPNIEDYSGISDTEEENSKFDSNQINPIHFGEQMPQFFSTFFTDSSKMADPGPAQSKPQPPEPSLNLKIYKGFYCEAADCRRLFKTLRDLNQHLLENEGDAHHLLLCELCGKNFHKRQQMRSHVDQYHREYCCPWCATIINGSYFMGQHERRVHNVSRDIPTECTVCHKLCKSRRKMLIHRKNVHLKSPTDTYICQECGKIMTTKEGWKSHQRVHIGELPFECDQCGKRCRTRGHLNCHIATHVTENKYECDICGLMLKTKGYLSVHKKMHDSKSEVPCSVCGKVFKHWSYLKSHMLTHADLPKTVPCTEPGCNRMFKIEKEMRAHVRIIHGEKEFKCDQCDKAYTLQKHLILHQESAHIKERKYVCTYQDCNKAYYRETHLRYHTKAIHLGQPRVPKEGSSTEVFTID